MRACKNKKIVMNWNFIRLHLGCMSTSREPSLVQQILEGWHSKLAFRGLSNFSPAAYFQQQSTKEKKDLGKMKSGWVLKEANSCCSK